MKPDRGELGKAMKILEQAGITQSPGDWVFEDIGRSASGASFAFVRCGGLGMSKRVWFNRAGEEWLTEGDTGKTDEWDADEVLTQAGLLTTGAFRHGGYRFKDPLRAARLFCASRDLRCCRGNEN